jgi:antitoxin component HigA of HigAB toxin-antitoxin module
MNDKLEQHPSSTPSHWREAAEFRQANKAWLRHSQQIAMMMLDKMEELHLTQKALSERMGCTQQYVSKILRGQENLSIETICKIEEALSLQILPKSSRLNKINSGSHV